MVEWMNPSNSLDDKLHAEKWADNWITWTCFELFLKLCHLEVKLIFNILFFAFPKFFIRKSGSKIDPNYFRKMEYFYSFQIYSKCQLFLSDYEWTAVAEITNQVKKDFIFLSFDIKAIRWLSVVIHDRLVASHKNSQVERPVVVMRWIYF